MATKRTTSARTKKAMMDSRNTLGGFTIIEVVLVLAIAGLIFMMVFIALPQLQRAQRDTQRRNDMGRLASAITQYQTNNNGKIPPADADSTKFIENYLLGADGVADEDFADPTSGESYTINFAGEVSSPAYGGDSSKREMDYTIHYYIGGKCDGEDVVTASGKRVYAIQYKLEGNGVYCSDNAG